MYHDMKYISHAIVIFYFVFFFDFLFSLGDDQDRGNSFFQVINFRYKELLLYKNYRYVIHF